MLLNSFSSYSSGVSTADIFGAMYVDDVEKIKYNSGEITNGITFNSSSTPTSLAQILNVSGSGIFMFNESSLNIYRVDDHNGETVNFLTKITIDNHVVSNILYKRNKVTSNAGSVFTITNVPCNFLYTKKENNVIYYYKDYDFGGSGNEIIRTSVSNDEKQILSEHSTDLISSLIRLLDVPLKFNSNLKIEVGASISGAKDENEKITYNYTYILE